MKIIVTGASGRTSRKIIDNLLSRGVPASDLILISRSPEREEVAAYGKMGASLRYGDFTDLATLPSAFAGGELMYFMPLNHPPDDVDETAVKREVIAIAKKAGIKHCVYQSMIGAGLARSCDDDFETENALRDSGIDWVILRTAIFSESLGRECKRYINEGKIAIFDPDMRRSYVTRDDIAAAGAEALLNPRHAGHIYHLIGGTITTRELAATLSEISGKPIAIVPAAKSAWGGGLGEPDNDLPQLIGHEGTHPLDQLRDQSQELLTGRPTGAEVMFGFQWQARGQETRPDDLGLVMQRLYRAMKAGDGNAASSFHQKLGENAQRTELWRRIHPEWFA